jgi:steroid 5-alpha reductase family enzyme
MLNKIKRSKFASYTVIFLMYAVATMVGIFIFSLNKNGNDILFLFFADFIATVVIWLFGVWFKNSSIYDPYWSVAPPVILTFLAFYYGIFSMPVILLLIAIWFWAVRLTINWIYTFPNLSHQDWRYMQFKQKFPKIWQLINFTGIHLVPTIVVFLAMIPAFYTLQIKADANIFTWLSFALCICAVILQLVSDIQMHRFRKNNTGKICNKGLWKYSRHPNYLGEILLWWGVYFILISIAPQYWWTIFGPLANNMLFLFVSIPLMEKRQLKNKPEYADYIKTTSRLIFMPSKRK